MKQVVFVTGNKRKAEYLNELLGLTIDHQSVDIEEIQSHDLAEVAKQKAIRAFEMIKKPVLVEDVGLEFEALNGLPGPFIKFFVAHEDGLENCCRMLDGFKSRRATARSVFAYYDGHEVTLLEGSLHGTIADHPKGENGWDWDHIFCPDGYDGRSRAELNKTEDKETYLTIKPIHELRKFLRDE
jgi:non-canonical purine NTP pyrophosphatase (RdgB/HAM1 family)